MKKLCLIIFSIISIFFLTGCYDKLEANEVAYVLAIGIDKSENNPDNFSITFEFVLPMAVENNSGSDSKASTYTTVEATSLYSAVNLVNSYISKEINLSHNKLVVFSEEVAIDGLSEHTSTIAHDRHFRSNMHILISKCKAKDYIEKTTSIFEKNPAKFYQSLFETYKYTGFTDNSYLADYIIKSSYTTSQPVAMLGNISLSTDDTTKEESNVLPNETYKPNNANYLSGKIEKQGGSQTEILGLAVFRYSRLVGELTGEETLYYLITTNKFGESNFTIYDPLSNDSIIDFNLSKWKNTESSVSFIDGTPLIKVKAYINANILSINLNVDYMNNKNISKLEDELEYIMETGMKNYLYKTSKVFRSDISGFGQDAVKNYITWSEWKESNWLDMYQFAYFNVDFDINIDRTGLVFVD
ncbi:MAG: Ger(x)C family spore germination protein [Clostridiales bacterium]|nr:Ger(x)C family spore germination protein [Clostridiales bacterium]